jgi:hypothetical protein
MYQSVTPFQNFETRYSYPHQQTHHPSSLSDISHFSQDQPCSTSHNLSGVAPPTMSNRGNSSTSTSAAPLSINSHPDFNSLLDNNSMMEQLLIGSGNFANWDVSQTHSQQ